MPTIRKRGAKYHVQVRKKGYPPISKTFSARKLAETFAKDVESKIERGVFQDTFQAENTMFRGLVERYERDILPSKKGCETELFNIRPNSRKHPEAGIIVMSGLLLLQKELIYTGNGKSGVPICLFR
jgi:hypothetical protein